MLRVHPMQNWFALSDPAMEEALYEIVSLRAFAHLNFVEPIPDEATILNFRQLLEADDILPKEQVRDLAREAAGRRILVVAGFMLPDARLNKAMTRLAALPNVYVMAETISNLQMASVPTETAILIQCCPPGSRVFVSMAFEGTASVMIPGFSIPSV